ncbi:MAG: hypothetical protein EBS07_12165 [Sphingobacteriia bacterium]|nr:hypothetical protein [Sphingobacteriia bacterium]
MPTPVTSPKVGALGGANPRNISKSGGLSGCQPPLGGVPGDFSRGVNGGSATPQPWFPFGSETPAL